MAESPRSKLLLTRLGCLAAAVVIVLLIYLLSVDAFKRDPYRAFKKPAQQAAYLAACAPCAESTVENPSPQRFGLIWIVSAADGSPAANYAGQNPYQAILAGSPGQVGTLVCVGDAHRYSTGRYESGKPAYQLSRKVCLVDAASGAITYQATLRGGDPPGGWTEANQGTGADPKWAELETLLLSLPVR